MRKSSILSTGKDHPLIVSKRQADRHASMLTVAMCPEAKRRPTTVDG